MPLVAGPIECPKPFASPQFPELDRTVQRSTQDAIVIKLQTRDPVRVGVVQRQHAGAATDVPDLCQNGGKFEFDRSDKDGEIVCW